MTLASVQPVTTIAVDAAALKKTLAKIKPALPKGGYSVPVLQAVRIDATSEGVLLTATNLDDTLSVRMEGIVTEPGSVLVPAKLLDKLLLARGKGTVEITGPAQGVEPAVRCGNLELSFEALDINEYPRIKTGAGRTIELNLDAITDIKAAISKDDSRPILYAVLVEHGAYVATDSYRLHCVNTATDTGDAFLIGRDGALIATKYKGTVMAKVHERDVTILLDENTTLVTRIVDGTFPLYKNLIPKNPPHEITFTDEFLTDVKALCKAADADPSCPVRISGGVDCLEVTITSGSTGRKAKVTTPGSTTGLVDGIGFTPQYLTELLTGTTSNALLATDRLKPSVLREAAPELGDGAERVRLIMPVRMS